MYKYLEKENEISFDKIFNQILGKNRSFQIYDYIVDLLNWIFWMEFDYF